MTSVHDPGSALPPLPRPGPEPSRPAASTTSPVPAGPASPAKQPPPAPFADQVRLEADGEDQYLGLCHEGRKGAGFGGSVLAQALAAACRTVSGQRPVHSLHAYFLRPVSCEEKVAYRALRMRDGRSYSLRQVLARQSAGEVLSLHASFKSPEPDGHRSQVEAPGVPGPEGLADALDGHRSPALREVLDLRYVPEEEVQVGGPEGEFTLHTWSRTRLPLPPESAAHACALAYLSDVTLAPTATRAFHRVFPRSGGSPVRLVSLDHALWFHRPVRADAWLLFAQRSRIAADGRALCQGEFFTRDGELVATAAQEALLRAPAD
ncbi:acyl-CoA thioesterase [Streptomyces sp. SCSIO ZS0520]|uniref:acyl-CoA thioesterase n=1 Tax=Streptomyces sp. SCSIO ZS0520 TaxID=2892996 RepID=UPI0021D9657A|nr:acyl-CoA thioesterase domain-containing protein [Streptomyces sp. SCSIO ZS0520]